MRQLSLVATLAAALLLAPASQAAITEDSGNIEVFVGWYFPDEDIPGQNLDDVTYGLRGGFNFTRHFMMQFGGQFFSTDFDSGLGTVDIDQWMFDVSFGWLVNPDSRGVFTLYGGPGWARTEEDDPVGKDVSDSAFSAHLGIGVIVQVGERFYVRPDARYRWIDGDDTSDDRGDWEATFGFGWVLGGN